MDGVISTHLYKAKETMELFYVHNLNTTSITKFEQLPNELLLMCFHYFDFFHLYEIFFYLNQRFNQLIQYETKIHIDLSLIPSRKFLTFCFQLNQLITTSENYPLSIVVHDKYRINLILEDDLFKDKFSKLKSLSLSNINVEIVYSIIFDKTAKLYESLEQLSLLDGIGAKHSGVFDRENLCCKLISSKMKSLKYLNLNFKPHCCASECGLFTPDKHRQLRQQIQLYH
ncbi:unnamed protein product [Rotaria sp. Silwood1]|nr:unnamed protein product [Rotaria sp. Silwood1]CAF4968096.1 unnamed protein product [Rotaria sp. Silwood1]